MCNGRRQLSGDSEKDSERDRHGRSVATSEPNKMDSDNRTSCFTKDNCSHFLLLTGGHPKHCPSDARRRIPDRTCRDVATLPFVGRHGRDADQVAKESSLRWMKSVKCHCRPYRLDLDLGLVRVG